MNGLNFHDEMVSKMDKPLWKSDEHFISACNESYQQGKTDGVREFAEWLLHHSMLCDSFGQDMNDYDLLSEDEIINEVLSEYEKEQKICWKI